ncbi:MAG TPA: GNAT family N-acetyltransferase [Candidatus Limiplasma sp.]|nr:GNAT family N-acetyltransferase [Candidatus Limiplasma sp.]HPS81574.1 GNAT family N-acetyltransferase [Candidatus Limiplasma sp.]
MPDSLCFVARDPAHPDAALLLNELSGELARITGCDGRASFRTEDVRGADAVFLVGYRGASPVACGGFRALTPDVAEVKRVYTREHGTGQALLQALEKMAACKGYARLVCETRRVNRRAVAFYLRAGWRETTPYGSYVGRPEAICFEKLLAATPVTHYGAL